MKIDYLWLCEYLSEKPAIDEVVSNLKKIGFGVESVKRIGADCENVITAKVLEVKKHPNADRLSICRVTTGGDEYEVVCGASNVKEGIKVPFALVGARVKDVVIKKARIRGVESNGMICSAYELGLEEKASSGIMILDDEIPLGRDIREFFKDNYLLDIEITPNLAYCLSHYGLARELSIFAGYKFSKPEIVKEDFINEIDFKIEIKTPNCLRYLGIVIKGIANKQTPRFILERLERLGLNPKGNLLIDLSNYVMFDIGQPNHFFDLTKIDSIIVRQAVEGESIDCLDGRKYQLSPDIMIIADLKKPIAIAGVIGGVETAIDDKTSDVFVEIANFKANSVRLASKKLSVKTDSSYRFERGVDYNLVELAARRIIHFIKQTNPSAKVMMIKDVKNIPYTPLVIDVDIKKIESILGMEVEKEKLNELLKAMDGSFDGVHFTVPSYRYDLTNIWDITEEYLRYVGYDAVPSKTNMPVVKSLEDPLIKIREDISLKLSKLGFNECYSYDLVSEKDIILSGFDVKDALRIVNPISKEFEFLRPSGLPSMLKVLRHNINRDVRSVSIYEFGKVFSKKDNSVEEKEKIFILLWGLNSEWEWWRVKSRKVDFFDLKTAVDLILGYQSNWEVSCKNSSLAYGGLIRYKDEEIGWAGRIRREVLRGFDVKADDVFYAELDLGVMMKFYESDFYKMVKKPIKPSPYQCGIRDLSVVVEKRYSFAEILSAIDNLPDIYSIELIDLYEDERIGKDKRSLTFRFTFSSYHKTFTDDELNEKIKEIFLILNKKFSASLR